MRRALGLVCLVLAALGPAAGPAVAQGALGPPIQVIITKEPARLILVAGDPVYLPADEAKTVLRVANASGPLVRVAASGRFWARAGADWFSADAIEGPYKRGGSPPTAVGSPADAGGAPADQERVAELYVRTTRAVLIRMPERLKLTAIGPPGGVHTAENAGGADLFFNGRDARYYLLVGGRWQVANQLAGPWTPVEQMPALFAEIPPTDPRGYVLAAIRDTTVYEEAVAAVQRARLERVPIDRTIDVAYAGAPVFEPVGVEGADVAYALNADADVFRAGGVYYACRDGVWFLAAAAEGPWSVCAVVPDALYAIPADHPAHRVTAVRVHPSDESGTLLSIVGPGYDGWHVVDGRVLHETWYGPYPQGVVQDGVYYGPYAHGAYPAPEFGNWGRGDWAERVRKRKEAAEDAAATPAAQALPPVEPEPILSKEQLEERRRAIEEEGALPKWMRRK